MQDDAKPAFHPQVAKPSSEAHARDCEISFQQMGVWLHGHLAEGELYNLVYYRIFDEMLDERAARHAIDTIVARHAALRCVFRIEQGKVLQKTLDGARAPWASSRFASMDAIAQQAHVAARADAENRRPFDLAAGPLLRVEYIALGAGRCALILAVHHICFDAWSIGIFESEFNALYDAAIAGLHVDLPDVDGHYLDYCRAQHERVHDADFGESVEYWRQRLSDLPPLHGLPLDAPRSVRRAHRGGLYAAGLGASLSRRLADRAAASGVSLFMAIHAAFATLIARHSNRSDVVIGVPFANRFDMQGDGVDRDQIIGMFADPLVLRVDCSAGYTFSDLLDAVRTASIEAYEHSVVPFSLLIRELGIERDDRVTPLFQIMLNMAEEGGDEGAPSGFRLALTDQAKYDLNLYVSNDAGEIGFHFTYNAEIFTEETIRTWHRHLVRLIDSAVADPSCNLYLLPMLDEEERSRIIEHSIGSAPAAIGLPLVSAFDAQARRSPDRVALVDQTVSLRYDEFSERVDRIASALIRAVPADAGRQRIVAFQVPRGNDTLALMLGISKAGMAFLCLDAEAPKARNRMIIEDARPSLLVCVDAAEWSDIPQCAILDMDAILAAPCDVPDTELPVPRPDDMMYVVYTSGSTGMPKGVVVEHRQFANFAAGFRSQHEALGLPELDSWLVSQSFTFDPALIALCMLARGAKVVILSDEQMRDPEQILQVVRQHRIQVFKSSPKLALALIERVQDRDVAPHLIVGGDDTSTADFERIQAYCERFGRKAVNAYGPTETTINCVFDLMERDVAIGRPMAGCRAYVLGENMSLLPFGSVGELCIGGDSVARGYLGHPDLTAHAFVADPFSQDGIGRIYRTGDHVRRLRDGRLQFVGRRDAQVKLRGYRVEIAEVERAIRDTSLVRDVRVLFKPETQQLLAFVIPSAEPADASAGDTPTRLQAALERVLPSYMQPARYVLIGTWPTTRHGKVDREALMTTAAHSGDAPVGRQPAGEFECTLAAIWSSLLDVPVDAIATDSCFFRLGGHSLIAIQLLSKVYDAFGLLLQVRDILENSRFSQLSDKIRSSMGGHSEAIPAQGHAAGRFHASYSQNKFWFVDDLSETGNRFNIVMRIPLDAACDETIVRRSLDMLIERHEVLRSTFEHADGLWQVVHAPSPCPFLAIDLRAESDEGRRHRMASILRDAYGLPRNLRTGPLIEAILVREPQGSHLLLNIHHIVSDAWSNQLIVDEFMRCHEAFSCDRQPELPALPIQYSDYAVWQKQRLSMRLPELASYWTRRLDELPSVHRLALDFPRPSVQGSAGAYHVHVIDRLHQQGLSSLFLQHRATLFVGLQSLFSAFLSRLSGESDIVIGTASANRDHPHTRHVVGAFLDTVVLRNDVRSERTFTEHLVTTRDAALADQAHFDMPFEALVRALNPERNSAYSPLFQLVLNLVYSDNDILGYDAQDAVDAQHRISVNYDLTLYVQPKAQGLELTWCYATDLFRPETIARMANSFETLLSAVVADPQQPLHALPLVDEDERAALVALSAGPVPERASVLLPAMIRANAQLRGDAVAVRLEDEVLDHAELEARSNRIARALVAAGVQVGDRVGICQERSLDMVASVIGTMKAGAVYVPLDPGYPDERLAWLLSDAGIGHVLTEAHLAAQLPLSGQRVVLVSDAANGDGGEYASPVSAETLAYMIYTSGSTGEPKGVCVSHGALADKLPALAQHYGLDASDRGLLFASMSFDASLSQLLVPLSVGGSVSVRPDGVTEPSALLSYVAEQGVTWMHVVPAYLRQLVEVPGWSRTALRRVTSGGDVLDAGLRSAWFSEERAGIELHNSYGPTEVAITSSVYRVRGDETVVGIGRPLSHVRYWVLDARGGLLPRGAVGELCIGGSCLAAGYWGREAQTSERFVTLEVQPGRRERLYRTGDRVRWGEGGQLVFVGRADHQVKVRGYRIELGEVESALRGCAGVSGAVVKVEDDSLWAYVSLSGTGVAEVEAWLSERLPAYLLPSGYEVVEEWPLTRSGKIDRTALRRGQAGAAKRRGPANEVESSLLEIWSTLLKSDGIGVTDNFFQRGGHSLLATRLASQIRKRFEVDFTLKSLFELPSIEEQALFIEVLRKKSRTDEGRNEGGDKEAVEEFSL
jgi:amino acid adenylation domain-containing protein